ncbi:hypothetical protein FNYG_04492 [Fusarium nygamai]|uniref:Uncharacterized protein n=1 Tax=Gibberella nygamai TaxID=42673 RepID=A0A2K0WJ51_GIBNY|nr:hypothetical protein FNYG_04492 [Fusarium nygamai]
MAFKHGPSKSTWEKTLNICKQSFNGDDFDHIEQLQDYDIMVHNLETFKSKGTDAVSHLSF